MTERTPVTVDFTGFVAGLVASATAILGQVQSLLEVGAPGSAGETGDDASDVERATSSPGTAEGEPARPSGEEVEEAIEGGLLTVRQLIDTLAMLQEKTKGNLTQQEGELLETALTELRLTYVRLTNRRPLRGPGSGEEVGG